MSELLTVAAPIAASILIAIFGTVIAPSLRLPRTMRRDLESDAQVLDKLPETAQSELKADMGRRATELVSYSHWPSLTRLDLLGGLGVVALAAANVYLVARPTTLSSEYVDSDTLIGLGTAATVQAAVWTVLLRGWAARVAARLEYLRFHLGKTESMEAARLVHTGLFLMRLFATLLIPGVLFAAGTIEIRHGYSGGGFETFEVVWAVAYGLLFLFFVWAFASKSRTPDLNPLLPPFEWVRHLSGPPPPTTPPPDQPEPSP